MEGGCGGWVVARWWWGWAFAIARPGACGRFWLASAFKGAESPDAVLPDLRMRAANQRSWVLECGTEAAPARRAAGVILTGWSRFGHLMPLTEPLPAAMPALFQALAAWSGTEASKQLEASWRLDDVAGRAVLAMCNEQAEMQLQLAALEEMHRLSVPPATAIRLV